MALITMVRSSDGQTMTIDENSPLRTSLKSQGFTEQTTTPTTATPTSTGYVDPATGNPTAYGVGMSQADYDKQIGKTTSPTTTTSTSTPATISPEDKAWVNAAYQKYFDRPATSAELNNWAKETPAALDQFLAKEQKTYGYVSTAMGAERKARYDAAIKVINESNLPDDIKQIWRTTVGMYPDATDFNTTEIMDTFNKIKTSTIDPYYKELADVAIKDVQTSIGQMSDTRQRELEAEQVNAQNAITGVKSNLESKGMTFSGQGVEQLGTGSAYAATGASAPVQTPFAGIDPAKMQGAVGQANRLISTSTAARYTADQQALGRKAEDLLGTAGASQISGLNYTPAGVNLTGSNALAKEEKAGSVLQSLVNQWRAKQENALNK